jgi:DNA-binding response OmpR family regulator
MSQEADVRGAQVGGDVLVVEDDAEICNALTWLFEEEKIPLRLAANGDEALAQVHEALPALILLDLTMPGLPAAEVMRQLRGDARTASVPVLVLSAARDVAQRAREVGADGAVAKPYDVDALLSAVREHARGGRW